MKKKLKQKNNPIWIQAADELENKLQFIEAGIDSQFELIEAAKDSDSKLKKFKIVSYTGGKIRQRFSMYPIVIDLSGMKVTAKSRPILREHDRSKIVGHTDNINISNSRITLAGTLSGSNQYSREVSESAQNGFPWQASIGATSDQFDFIDKGNKVTVNGRNFNGPVYVARKSVLQEVSFVALGADDNTSAKVAATLIEGNSKMNEFDKWLEASGFVKENLTEGQLKALQATFDAAQETDGGGDNAEGNSNGVQASAPAAQVPAPVAASSVDPVAQVQADIRAGAANEMNRINAINALDYNNSEIKAKAIDEEWDVQKTELELLRADRSSGPSIHSTNKPSQAGADVIEAALLINSGAVSAEDVGKHFDEKTMNAAVSGDMQGYGIHAFLHQVITAAGGHARAGQIGDTFIKAAADASRSIQAAGGGFSTVSLPGILGNVANKVALISYNSVETVSKLFCHIASMNDFKTRTGYRLTANGTLDQVGPDGELKHGTLSEQAYSNKLDTFGKMFGLNRQMIINDDLDMFANIPRLMGRQGALSLEEAVFTLLLDNPSFFTVGNKNYLTGASTNLQISSLTSAQQLFRDQTDSAGKPIMLSPKLMLVPTTEEVNADLIYADKTVNETTTANKPKIATNPHVGKFKPISSPYLNAQGLTNSSDSGWYLFANPNDVAAMEIAFLKGRQVPHIETQDSAFNVLGVEFRTYFDFGVAMGDPNAAVFVKGEA
jgi:hypothetical protein